MRRSLFAERFGLQTHRETKGGPKLHASDGTARPPIVCPGGMEAAPANLDTSSLPYWHDRLQARPEQDRSGRNLRYKAGLRAGRQRASTMPAYRELLLFREGLSQNLGNLTAQQGSMVYSCLLDEVASRNGI
jgi:hypothetical protein